MRDERLREEQRAQQLGESSPLGCRQGAEESLLVRKVRDDSCVDGSLSFGGEGDERATSIVRIRQTFDKAERLHSIDPVRHRAR